eukprot:CAMPEP_0178787510 /NCGR_PEP_ID=MMETSP0745-20121128/5892_1 /TAXON_ID=913974 /ORGANISM="Nitzschia punctata, Strain CCMP561" /LENGTH=146 /DNA_ID=CAMNT_0020445363 /DNA_START=125 /DNA_END=563 /DNA_ORIENTATION=-
MIFDLVTDVNVDRQTISRTLLPPKEKEEQDVSQKNTKKEQAWGHHPAERLHLLQLLGDLIQEIDHIQAMGQFNCIIIKSTGITEPQQVAESSCVEPATMALATQNDNRSEQQDQENEASTSTLKMVNMLNKYVRLETCVTAVGAAN